MISSSAEILKSVKIRQSYKEFKGGNFFETQCKFRSLMITVICSYMYYFKIIIIHCHWDLWTLIVNLRTPISKARGPKVRSLWHWRLTTIVHLSTIMTCWPCDILWPSALECLLLMVLSINCVLILSFLSLAYLIGTLREIGIARLPLRLKLRNVGTFWERWWIWEKVIWVKNVRSKHL